MKATMMVARNKVRLGTSLIIVIVTVIMVMVFSLSIFFTPANADAFFAVPLCGAGSAPEYGFTYDLQQPHWTVDWQNHVSEQTVIEVDEILDQLNADSIAQTMILIKPQEQVGNRVNCAVHFLRYMQLGLPEGERKDNGFVFLIVVEADRIDVHYGVGLGLPALTAPELTSLNRAAEDVYQSTHSMDKALLTLVQEFDAVARSNYSPLILPAPTQETLTAPQLPAGPLGILSTCCVPCLGIFFLFFFMWAMSQMSRGGINFGPPGAGPFGGGSGFPSGWGRGGGSGSSGPSMRGGSGSGRSGRGN